MCEYGGDWQRLRDVCVKHGAVVVLHGASGLPHTLVQVRGRYEKSEEEYSRACLTIVFYVEVVGVVESGGIASVRGVVLGMCDCRR